METLDEPENSPTFFSKAAILLLSSLYSPLFGAMVYISNLQEVNKKKFIFPTVVSMLILNAFILNKLHPTLSFIPFLIRYPLLNALGGLLMIGPFWDYHLKEEKIYQERSIWSPFLAGFFLFGGFIALGFYFKYQNS